MFGPKGNRKDLIGEEGVRALGGLLGQVQMYHFEVPQDADYGLDVIGYLPIYYIDDESAGAPLTERIRRQIADMAFSGDGESSIGSAVSGALVAFQVKAHKCIANADDKEFWSENIETSTLKHWQSSQLPVVLVIYDVKTETMRYRMMRPSDYDDRISEQKTISVRCHDVLDVDSLRRLLRMVRGELHRHAALESVANLYADDSAEQLEAVRRAWMLMGDVVCVRSIAHAFPYLQAEARCEAAVMLSAYIVEYQEFRKRQIDKILSNYDPSLWTEAQCQEVMRMLERLDGEAKSAIDSVRSIVSRYPLESWAAVVSQHENVHMMAIVTSPETVQAEGQVYVRPGQSWPDTDQDETLDEADFFRQRVMAYGGGSSMDAATGLLSYLEHPECVIEQLYGKRNEPGFRELFDKRNGRWWLDLYRASLAPWDRPRRDDYERCEVSFKNKLAQDGMLSG